MNPEIRRLHCPLRPASLLRVTRPVDAVIEFLEAEQARGVTHVLLDESARNSLRNLHFKIRGSKDAPQATAPATASPEPTPEPAAPAPAPTSVGSEGQTKQERLASLRKQAESWAPAKSLGTFRETMVFATGNPDAKLMFIGEAPGHEEEKKREPFVGPAGQKLNDILKAMGLEREDVYLSSIVKFRPATARQTTNNRKPSPEEIAACLPFIREEIAIVRPACIVALGATAAEALLGLDHASAGIRGAWHEFDGIPVCVTWHPGYLLQSNADVSIKRQFWEDMLAVMEKLNLTISERQRGFFLPKA